MQRCSFIFVRILLVQNSTILLVNVAFSPKMGIYDTIKNKFSVGSANAEAVMILCRKSFSWNFRNKVSAVPWCRFLLSSDSSCGTHLVSFWTFYTAYKRTEMTCHVTPSCSSSSFSVYAKFVSSKACNSSVSTFWGRPARGSSSRQKSP